jgi:hypothetical protein
VPIGCSLIDVRINCNLKHPVDLQQLTVGLEVLECDLVLLSEDDRAAGWHGAGPGRYIDA